jgi:two-component system alkaline phosphatase synthesis response regulator PhoP
MSDNPIKIVVADDEQFITTAYSDGLQRAGFSVIIAHNGEEAYKKVVDEKPNLVLLDLIMPKMNGFEVLKTLKSSTELKHIPVVILSNLSQETDEDEAKKLGAIDFIVKSDISLEDLVTRINKLLK